MPDPEAVNQFFSNIAPGYDRANRVMSSGIDVLWRRYLTRRVAAVRPQQLLDLATGSGDVAFALAKRVSGLERLVASDFCQPMLDVAITKQERKKGSLFIEFMQGDCLDLPFETASFDAITIAFGLRNLADRHQGLSEMLRVLRPGGSLFVLEFTQPDRWIRGPYYFYLQHVIPRISGWITGHSDAYEYLGASIEEFPTKQTIADEMERAGFAGVDYRGLTFSIATVHSGIKAEGL